MKTATGSTCHSLFEEVQSNLLKLHFKTTFGSTSILADNHITLPWRVSSEVLYAISDTMKPWGYIRLDLLLKWS